MEFLQYQKSGKVAWVYTKYSDFSPEGSNHGDTIKIVKYRPLVLKNWILIDNKTEMYQLWLFLLDLNRNKIVSVPNQVKLHNGLDSTQRSDQ